MPSPTDPFPRLPRGILWVLDTTPRTEPDTRLDPEYLGPAALNRAFTLIHDSRDGAREVRLEIVDGEHGCWRCHSLYNCTEVCPKHLSPTSAIKGLKRAIVQDWFWRKTQQ